MEVHDRNLGATMQDPIGRQVKEARDHQGLSLRALAARSGLSINAISRIERGESSPTVASLARLAQALGLPMTALFEPAPAGLATVLRRDRRLRSEVEGVVLESLTPGLPQQRFEPFMLTLEPGAASPPGPAAHPGQEFLLCLQGSLICQIGGESHRLGAGDSLFFEATQPHRCLNQGPGFATLIVVHERDPQAAPSPHLGF
jgi:transcriptional regulator with XRE-family HTH domain